MYSWGAVSNGELGLGGLEKPHVALPSKVPLSDTIRYVLVVREVRGLTGVFSECPQWSREAVTA